MPDEVAAQIAEVVAAALASRSDRDVATALLAVEPDSIAAFYHAGFLETPVGPPAAAGLPASPGVASGRIVFSARAALEVDGPVVLVRPHTTPDDVAGMQAAAGVVTSRGGQASHAAVVARSSGTPAVVGVEALSFEGSRVRIGAFECSEGDHISIDGSTGEIFVGSLAVASSEPPEELEILLTWADSVMRGRVEVRANADTAAEAALGRGLGATGIGLCRTEHMFLSAGRLELMRRFILADDAATEAAALDELEQAQAADFEELLEAMDGLPVTVRLLDPPLHEFLPDQMELTVREARGDLGDHERAELAAVRRLQEVNPMIGTRGVRLGIVRPGLYEMQVRALGRAVVGLLGKGRSPRIQIMVPLVADASELRLAREWVTEALDQIGHPELASSVVEVGAMIETPRAALTAQALAEHADFFSFGTNDLTQLTYGFSRDDVEIKLLPSYESRGLLAANPFAVIDRTGVGELIAIACERARQAKPPIRLGVCGEQAADPASIAFLVEAGIDSVSCSPLRVPAARLAVARALLESNTVDPSDVVFDFWREVGASSPAPAQSSKHQAEPGTHPGVDETLLLHVLRVKGLATIEALVESMGTHPGESLMVLVEAGFVRHVEKQDMFMLVSEGRERHQALLQGWVDDSTKSAARDVYTTFLTVNDEFKKLCTDWQMRGDAPNDHSDADYDRHCLERLVRIGDEAGRIISDLAKAFPRFERYRTRMNAALERALSGDAKAFTGVNCGSVHDVWMEMHEDLIVLLGVDRLDEGSF